MPGFDGTGPAGQGPLSGRGMGYCAVQVSRLPSVRGRVTPAAIPFGPWIARLPRLAPYRFAGIGYAGLGRRRWPGSGRGFGRRGGRRGGWW
jgi:hypothetical protein